jgi:threonine-phosphate decarboxylase
MKSLAGTRQALAADASNQIVPCRNICISEKRREDGVLQKYEHGGNVYEKCPTGEAWLDFSANINPLGLSPRVKEAVLSHIDGIVNYPDPEARALKAAIASFYDVPQENIVLGNGAAELFYCFFYIVRPRRLLLPVPSFSEYERAARAAGVKVVCLPLLKKHGFSLDLEAAIQQLSEEDVILLCSPNNPTGRLWERRDLHVLLEKAEERGAHVMMDESFLDFREDGERYTSRHLTKEYPHLFVVQSMTKFFALPGLRLGFGIAEPNLCRRLENGKDVWNVNLLAQAAGVAALSDTAYQEAARSFVCSEKKFLAAELAKLPRVEVFAPSVNFILFHLQQGKGFLRQLLMALRERGILLRDCSNYSGLDGAYLRAAVRSRADNERLLEALHEVWKE